MAFSLTPIIRKQFVATGSAADYFTAGGTGVRIDFLSVVNSDSAAHTVSIWLVPSGGSLGNSNVSTLNKTVQPGQTWNSPNELGAVLGAGDTIWAMASAASVLNIFASGVQQS